MVDPNANLIFGAVVDPAMEDTVSITIIATGFGAVEPEINALKQDRTRPAPPTIVAAPTAAPQVPVVPRPAPEPLLKAKSPEAGNGSGIEIPAFLRRRRLQGK